MGENQGEALATIGEIAQQHGDIHAAVRGSGHGLFNAFIDELRDDVAHFAAERPYSAVLAAVATGFFGGLSLALGRRGGHYSRGW
ncbi:MAG TPA: hypothetical protein VH722_04175 [Alphaproteobacteria bacterium]|jgi:hypothetical protein|nr:hypothetical protein [Alphaproteobacteria bacterium]